MDNYETGVFIAKVKYRYRWWQLWKPKYIKVEAGIYTKIGDKVCFNFKFGDIMIGGTSEKGMMTGMIKGLPF